MKKDYVGLFSLLSVVLALLMLFFAALYGGLNQFNILTSTYASIVLAGLVGTVIARSTNRLTSSVGLALYAFYSFGLLSIVLLDGNLFIFALAAFIFSLGLLIPSLFRMILAFFGYKVAEI